MLLDEKIGSGLKASKIGIRQSLSHIWRNGDLNYRIKLRFALAPDGLRWNSDKVFLNTAKPQLFQAYKELLRDLVCSGGPPSAVLNTLALS
jgi:hypothetical protein